MQMARYYEMDENDVILTVFTDSIEMYQSRLRELKGEFGEYTKKEANRDYTMFLLGQKTNNMICKKCKKDISKPTILS